MGVTGLPAWIRQHTSAGLGQVLLSSFLVAAYATASAAANMSLDQAVSQVAAASERGHGVGPDWIVAVDVSHVSYCLMGASVCASTAINLVLPLALIRICNFFLEKRAKHVYLVFDTTQDVQKNLQRGTNNVYRDRHTPVLMHDLLQKGEANCTADTVSVVCGVADFQLQLLVTQHLQTKDIVIVGWDSDLVCLPLDQFRGLLQTGPRRLYVIKAQGMAYVSGSTKVDIIDIGAVLEELSSSGVNSAELINAVAAVAGTDYSAGVSGWGVQKCVSLIAAQGIKNLKQLIAAIEVVSRQVVSDDDLDRINISYLTLNHALAMTDDGRWELVNPLGSVNSPIEGGDYHLGTHAQVVADCKEVLLMPRHADTADQQGQYIIDLLTRTYGPMSSLPFATNPSKLVLFRSGKCDETGHSLEVSGGLTALLSTASSDKQRIANALDAARWTPPTEGWVDSNGSKVFIPHGIPTQLKSTTTGQFYSYMSGVSLHIPKELHDTYDLKGSKPLLVQVNVDGVSGSMAVAAGLNQYGSGSYINFTLAGSGLNPISRYCGLYVLGYSGDLGKGSILQLHLGTCRPQQPVPLLKPISETQAVISAAFKVLQHVISAFPTSLDALISDDTVTQLDTDKRRHTLSFTGTGKVKQVTVHYYGTKDKARHIKDVVQLILYGSQPLPGYIPTKAHAIAGFCYPLTDYDMAAISAAQGSLHSTMADVPGRMSVTKAATCAGIWVRGLAKQGASLTTTDVSAHGAGKENAQDEQKPSAERVSRRTALAPLRNQPY